MVRKTPHHEFQLKAHIRIWARPNIISANRISLYDFLCVAKSNIQSCFAINILQLICFS